MKYKIVKKNNVLILSLEGDIGRQDKETFVACTKEILEKESTSTVIYFQSVNLIDPLVFRDITLLQHELRKKNITVRVVGLSLNLKILLSEKGVIRSNETFNDIKDVLIALMKPTA